MNAFEVFEFKDPGRLVDKDLELVLVEQRPADPDRGLVPEYKFEMRHVETAKRLGEIGLRTTLTPKLSEYGGHIGYEVESLYRGNRYAARSCKLLFSLANSHDINPMLITCSTNNAASKRTCEIIGAKLIEIKTIYVESGKPRPTCYYHVYF